MAKEGKRVLKKEKAPLKTTVKVLYIVVLVLAILIVAVFAACNIFIRPPDVDGQVTFPVASPSPDPGSGSGSGGQSAASPAPGSSESPEPSPSEEVIVYTRREGVYTCLLLGVADQGGADSIMLGFFDTTNKTASLISLPRDTLVLRKGKDGKLNAHYSDGGADAVVAAVTDMLGIPVDFWMSVNFRAFREIVDKVGGVNFYVPVDMDYDDPTADLHIHISKGYQRLYGADAEGVMRCRNCYPNADLGRVQTQRAFLTALVKQTITISNVTKVTNLIETLSKYVETNMTLDNMIYFATSAIGMDLDTDLASATLPGSWKSPYEEVDDEAALEMINKLLPVYTEPVTEKITNFRHRQET